MMGVLGNDDDALEAALGLGELAGLTVSNDADALTYDVSMLTCDVTILTCDVSILTYDVSI